MTIRFSVMILRLLPRQTDCSLNHFGVPDEQTALIRRIGSPGAGKPEPCQKHGLAAGEFFTHLREATRVAERIEDALRTPFVLDGDHTSITVSIGIALNTEGHAEPEDLVRDADTAMYKAKRAGKARYEVFQSEDAIGQMEGEGEFSVRRSAGRSGEPLTRCQTIAFDSAIYRPGATSSSGT